MKRAFMIESLAFFMTLVLSPCLVPAQEKTGEIGLHDNGYLEIIKVKVHDLGSSMKENKTVKDVTGVPMEYTRETSGSGDYVEVLVEVLKRVPEEKGHKVCIHYHDAHGDPMPGDSKYTEKNLSAGEIRAVVFDSMPYEAKTFKIWLPKVD